MATVTSFSIDEQQRLIAEMWRAFSAHDVDQLIALFTDDIVYEDVTMGAVNRGEQQVRAFVQGFFSGFPDVTFEMTSGFANGIGGGAEWVMRGTHTGDLPGMPATGKRIEVRGASIIEFAGDRISRVSDYWDMATFLRQLGLLPSGG